MVPELHIAVVQSQACQRVPTVFQGYENSGFVPAVACLSGQGLHDGCAHGGAAGRGERCLSCSSCLGALQQVQHGRWRLRCQNRQALRP